MGGVDIARRSRRAGLGDLKENGDYHAAKDHQGQMEARIRQGIQGMLEERRDRRGTAGEAVEPGCVEELRYEGDDDTDLYFFGSVEERGGPRHHQPRVAARRSAQRVLKPGDKVDFQSPTGANLTVEPRQHPVSGRQAEPEAPPRSWAPRPPRLAVRSSSPTAVRPSSATAHASRRRRPSLSIRVTADANWFTSPAPRSPSALAWWPSTTVATTRRIDADRAVRLADHADGAIAALDVLGVEAGDLRSGTPWAGRSRGSHGTATVAAWPGWCSAPPHRFRGVEPMLGLGPALVQRLAASPSLR